MKILLLGANGQLGRTFVQWHDQEQADTLIAASRDGRLADGRQGIAADMAHPAGLGALLDGVQPDVIINAAAYTAVDRAEQEEDLATTINGTSVGILGDWAARHKALVIHYSTDYVFDGEQARPYDVDAPTAPVNAYGRSKLAGERALLESGASVLVFRTAWVYAAQGHNFLRTMLRVGAEREELKVVADQHGAPTDTRLIVEATMAALTRWKHASAQEKTQLAGIHHLVASGETTWHGFASAIFTAAQERKLLANAPRVLPIRTEDYPTPARRPHHSVLNNQGFEATFGFHLPDWQSRLPLIMDEVAGCDA